MSYDPAVLAALYSFQHRRGNWKTLPLSTCLGLVSLIPSSCPVVRSGSLEAASRSSLIYLSVPFIEIWQSLWICEFLLPYLLSPSLFHVYPTEGLWCCKPTASWGEELRTDVLHSSFLSGKKEDEKILPEINGAIHMSRSCCIKLHLCLKPYSSPFCILTQLRTCNYDE